MDSGAHARREFHRLLDAEVRRAWRYKCAFSLFVVDVDPVKNAPVRTPRFLAAMVAHIRSALREIDSVGRLEQARFAVLLIECDASEALTVAGRAREAILSALKVKPEHVAVGIASYEGESPTTSSDLLTEAVQYLARARGGTGVMADSSE